MPVAVAGEGALTETTITVVVVVVVVAAAVVVVVGGAMPSLALAVEFLTMPLLVAAALLVGGEVDTSPSTVAAALLPWAWARTCEAHHPLLRR
jgi:hypothetical protein